jgi:hypothetical protein
MTDVYDLTRMGCGELRINSLLRLEDLSGVIPDFTMLKTLQAPKVMENGSTVYMPHSLFIDGEEVYLPVLERFEAVNDGGYATIYKGRRSIYIPDYEMGDTSRAIDGTLKFKCVSGGQEICIKSCSVQLSAKEARTTPNTRSMYFSDSIQYLIHEAIIHGLIQNVLTRAGFPSAVPILHEIVAMTHDGTIQHLTDATDIKEIWITMEILKGVTLQRFLRRKLIRLPTKFKRNAHQLLKEKQNEILILDVCFQLVCYLHILQENLRFNHRDMKIDNAFWRYHPYREQWKNNIFVENVGTWKCKHDFVLIDFGFGCISQSTGCSSTPFQTLLGASSWFDSDSTCMKYGRDMAQFLFALHCVFPLQEYISAELFTLFVNATEAVETDSDFHVVSKHKLFAGFDWTGKPNPLGKKETLPEKTIFDEGIYTFLEKPGVDVPGCRPKTLLHTLGQYAKRYTDSFIPIPHTSVLGCLCVPSTAKADN